jgi:multiple sugar transport system substrate-binding protein
MNAGIGGVGGKRDIRASTRRVLAAVAGTLLALTLSCGKGGGGSEIVFWQSWPADVIAPLIAKFEQSHPGVKVRVAQLDRASGIDTVSAAIASGNVPDLCELSSTYMPRMLASAALSDWSAGIADLRPSLRGWEICMIGDAVYGMPWVLETRALFYNKALMAVAGLDSTRPPETWDELYASARKIHNAAQGRHGFGVPVGGGELFESFMPLAWGNAGQILTADLSHSAFDSPEIREALDFYLKLAQVSLVDRQEVLDREFKAGRIGFMISGPWLFKTISTDAPRLRYSVALVPKPAVGHGTHASFKEGEVLVGFTASKNKPGALALARFLVQPENVLALADADPGIQPATVGADTGAYGRARPNQAMLRQLDTALAPPNHSAWIEMEAAIEDAVKQALDGSKTAAQAILDASTRLDQLAAKR